MLLALALAATIGAQTPAPPLPPPDSPPLVRIIEIRFPTQGDTSLVDPQTYLYYIHTAPSRPSAGVWSLYDRQSVLDDFDRLWKTGFLDDISIEETDEPYENGVVGKHIVYNLEERQRVKLIDFSGSKAVARDAIETALKDASASITLDTFIDLVVVRKVERIVRDLLKDKGFQFAKVTHQIDAMPGSPKLVRLTFQLDEGPKLQLREVTITGNSAIDEGTLKRQMQGNKTRPWWLPSFLAGTRTYQESKFPDDADRIVQYYRDRGFVTADVGVPTVKELGDDDDGKTRWIELSVPVVEGARFKVGAITFEGNTLVKSEALATVFGLATNDYYSEARVRKGLEQARQIYGVAGYFEFTGYPDLKPRDGNDKVVDVVMRFEEGRQFFINRINFIGNTTTQDSVARRELGLLEGGVFNIESLKTGVRRLNQLGYFKPLEEQKHVAVEKSKDLADRVDVTLKVEEQNRNQLTFGAGMSAYEGVFGNLSYTTANLLGRGESFTLSAQRGSRASTYQLSFGEPYLFNRPISGSIDLYSRKINYYTSTSAVGYSEVREGSTASLGWLLKNFTRLYLNHTWEVTNVAISDEFKSGIALTQSAGAPTLNPYAAAGKTIDSRLTPTLVRNTVDHPIFPHRGQRLTASMAIAGQALRGSFDYVKPEVEYVWYLPTSRRTGFGLRGNAGWLRTYGTTTTLPYYLRYFLGGETQIRGVNIRTVGPVNGDGVATGGNKFALFNAEFYVDIIKPLRLVLFHDAGQAFSETERVDLWRMRTSSGVEARFFMPVLNVPFRLIWSWNAYRDPWQPPSGFRFAIGTTF